MAFADTAIESVAKTRSDDELLEILPEHGEFLSCDDLPPATAFLEFLCFC